MTGSSTAVLDVPATIRPGVGWASGPLGEVQAADREIARQTARRYRAIAAFAATRPASADRVQGERGAMSAERWAARPEVLRPVSEWATQELSIALNVSAPRAQHDLERSLTLVQRLPLVLDALQAGVLHPGHLWCLLEHVAPIADDAVRTRIQRELLDWLAVRHRVTTPAQLGDRVRPRNGDLDHRWPDGPTAAANLAGLCTTDHRGKHRAPGWTHDLQPDGTLTVTTPSGLTAITEPPPY